MINLPSSAICLKHPESTVRSVTRRAWEAVVPLRNSPSTGSSSSRIDLQQATAGLKKALRDLHPVVPMPTGDQWYQQAFANFDGDRDGLISYDAFWQIIKQYHDHHGARNVRKYKEHLLALQQHQAPLVGPTFNKNHTTEPLLDVNAYGVLRNENYKTPEISLVHCISTISAGSNSYPDSKDSSALPYDNFVPHPSAVPMPSPCQSDSNNFPPRSSRRSRKVVPAGVSTSSFEKTAEIDGNRLPQDAKTETWRRKRNISIALPSSFSQFESLSSNENRTECSGPATAAIGPKNAAPSGESIVIVTVKRRQNPFPAVQVPPKENRQSNKSQDEQSPARVSFSGKRSGSPRFPFCFPEQRDKVANISLEEPTAPSLPPADTINQPNKDSPTSHTKNNEPISVVLQRLMSQESLVESLLRQSTSFQRMHTLRPQSKLLNSSGETASLDIESDDNQLSSLTGAYTISSTASPCATPHFDAAPQSLSPKSIFPQKSRYRYNKDSSDAGTEDHDLRVPKMSPNIPSDDSLIQSFNQIPPSNVLNRWEIGERASIASDRTAQSVQEGSATTADHQKKAIRQVQRPKRVDEYLTLLPPGVSVSENITSDVSQASSGNRPTRLERLLEVTAEGRGVRLLQANNERCSNSRRPRLFSGITGLICSSTHKTEMKVSAEKESQGPQSSYDEATARYNRRSERLRRTTSVDGAEAPARKSVFNSTGIFRAWSNMRSPPHSDALQTSLNCSGSLSQNASSTRPVPSTTMSRRVGKFSRRTAEPSEAEGQVSQLISSVDLPYTVHGPAAPPPLKNNSDGTDSSPLFSPNQASRTCPSMSRSSTPDRKSPMFSRSVTFGRRGMQSPSSISAAERDHKAKFSAFSIFEPESTEISSQLSPQATTRNQVRPSPFLPSCSVTFGGSAPGLLEENVSTVSMDMLDQELLYSPKHMPNTPTFEPAPMHAAELTRPSLKTRPTAIYSNERRNGGGIQRLKASWLRRLRARNERRRGGMGRLNQSSNDDSDFEHTQPRTLPTLELFDHVGDAYYQQKKHGAWADFSSTRPDFRSAEVISKTRRQSEGDNIFRGIRHKDTSDVAVAPALGRARGTVPTRQSPFLSPPSPLSAINPMFLLPPQATAGHHMFAQYSASPFVGSQISPNSQFTPYGLLPPQYLFNAQQAAAASYTRPFGSVTFNSNLATPPLGPVHQDMDFNMVASPAVLPGSSFVPGSPLGCLVPPAYGIPGLGPSSMAPFMSYYMNPAGYGTGYEFPVPTPIAKKPQRRNSTTSSKKLDLPEADCQDRTLAKLENCLRCCSPAQKNPSIEIIVNDSEKIVSETPEPVEHVGPTTAKLLDGLTETYMTNLEAILPPEIPLPRIGSAHDDEDDDFLPAPKSDVGATQSSTSRKRTTTRSREPSVAVSRSKDNLWPSKKGDTSPSDMRRTPSSTNTGGRLGRESCSSSLPHAGSTRTESDYAVPDERPFLAHMQTDRRRRLRSKTSRLSPSESRQLSDVLREPSEATTGPPQSRSHKASRPPPSPSVKLDLDVKECEVNPEIPNEMTTATALSKGKHSSVHKMFQDCSCCAPYDPSTELILERALKQPHAKDPLYSHGKQSELPEYPRLENASVRDRAPPTLDEISLRRARSNAPRDMSRRASATSSMTSWSHKAPSMSLRGQPPVVDGIALRPKRPARRRGSLGSLSAASSAQRSRRENKRNILPKSEVKTKINRKQTEAHRSPHGKATNAEFFGGRESRSTSRSKTVTPKVGRGDIGITNSALTTIPSGESGSECSPAAEFFS